MIYRIGFAGDLHKRPKDITTIKGYVNCCDKVQESLIDFIIKSMLTHFVSLGDWYDRGYVDDISAALADTSQEEYINKLLKGNFYGVIGNHIRLNLDSNPELSLIQPCELIKSRKSVKRDTPIIKTPVSFIVGNVQISLVHHMLNSTSVLDYSIFRHPGVKYHIACVHDPKFIPNSQLTKVGYMNTFSLDSQIAKVLDNVDLCICGDIHAPLGMFDISPKTKMIVPGSLTNTNSGKNGRHDSIKIPIITIDDEKDTVSFSFHEFNLHTNMVTFNEKKELDKDNKLSSIRGNNLDKLYEGKSIESIMSTGIGSMSLGNFLRDNNYTDNDKKLIKATISDPTNLINLMSIHIKDSMVEDIK